MDKYEQWPTDKFIGYANNPRDNDKAVDKIAEAIHAFGFRVPIIAKSDGTVIDGHLRLKAAKKLGLESLPVLLADDMSEADIKGFRISVNRMAELADWDLDLLKIEIEGLQELDFDIDLLGFDDDFIDGLMDEPVEGLTDEDAIPETPEEPITKRGDVWVLGNHRVMCGDSTMIDDVDVLMDGCYPDLIHTDPPYGINAVTKSGVLSKSYKIDIIGDDNTNIAKDSFKLIHGLFPDSKQIWWGANYYSSSLPDSECWLVWDKNNGQSDQTDCELAWANFRSVVRQFTQSSEKINRVHPTQKPVSLMEWIIKRFKLSSKSIADYFGGSGSTLIAAEKNGIDCYIMEYDPKFVDVIIKRWMDYTGKIAILESSGQEFKEVV